MYLYSSLEIRSDAKYQLQCQKNSWGDNIYTVTINEFGNYNMSLSLYGDYGKMVEMFKNILFELETLAEKEKAAKEAAATKNVSGNILEQKDGDCNVTQTV